MLQTIRFHAFFIVLLLLVSCSVDSSENSTEIEEVKIKLNEILPEEIELLSVQETDISGFFEVNFEGIEPLYVSSDGNYLVSGDIYLITKDGLVNKSEARRDYQRKTLINNLDTAEFISLCQEMHIALNPILEANHFTKGRTYCAAICMIVAKANLMQITQKQLSERTGYDVSTIRIQAKKILGLLGYNNLKEISGKTIGDMIKWEKYWL